MGVSSQGIRPPTNPVRFNRRLGEYVAGRDEILGLADRYAGPGSDAPQFRVIPLTTGNERTLKTGSQAGDLIDGWFTSPDGKQVAYPVVRGGQTELRIMNTDGSGDRALIPMQTVEIGIAAWSWDGRFLLYDSDYAGERARVINVATGESWDLLRDWPSWDSEASRAPDGSFVAVTTSDSRTRWELLRGVTYEAVARLMKK